MTSGINLPAIIIANLIGIILLFVVAIGNSWRLKTPSKENRILILIYFFCLISCIVDPLCFLSDGKPGTLCFICVFFGNTWLFIACTVISVAWFKLLSLHMGIKLAQIHKALIISSCAVLFLMLIINIFVPIVFSVNDSNVYERTSIYWIYFAVGGAVMLDGFIMYLLARRKSGKLRFFPVVAFIIPAIIGILIQSLCYGVSTIFPFIAVSFACTMMCLQNEFLFRDSLTGLYNRFYLNTIENIFKESPHSEYSAIMLDINHFKSINDNFGHKMGDKALVEIASILSNVINEKGTIIRYGGDEFIIILHSQNNSQIVQTTSDIQAAFSEFNKTSGNPYELSVALGHSSFSLNDQTMDDFLDEIDKKMYENKREYYKSLS